MLIGIISDTHIPDRSVELPKTVFEAFKDVEIIFHAGDITDMCVIESLEKIAPVICVQGNIDRLEGLNLPKSEKITIDGVKVGIIHGEVFPKGDTQQLKYIAKELDVDVLVTGHTHKPFIEKEEDIIILCPGSPTYPRLSDS
ncbi:MAG: YfcE family phosphodiesterase, partial [Methanobacteriaceae archaeon]